MGSLGGLGVKWECAEGQKMTQNEGKYRFFWPKYGCICPKFRTLKVQERSKSSKIVFVMFYWVQKCSWTWIWRENEHLRRWKWAKKSLFLTKKGVFMHRFSKFKALEDLWECQNCICDVLLSLKMVLDLYLEQKWEIWKWVRTLWAAVKVQKWKMDFWLINPLFWVDEVDGHEKSSHLIYHNLW